MSKLITVGSDFSGVGAFNQALNRIKEIKAEHVFSCDMDKFARQSYIANYGEPKYYPENVYDRKIPKESLDIYMTSPPCQSFSLAGKRKGKDSENGILFFNSHEFIQKNKPRYFIFENVKGLLSDDKRNKKDEFGNTFKEWCNMLGGKSVNGNAVIFPFENSVPYHIYFKVLNSKKHGVPQNRERVFIIGIRDDSDNSFTWPKEEYLSKKLKDILESDVDEKYFLSDKMVNQLIDNTENTDYLDVEKNAYSKTLRCGGGGSLTKKHNFDIIKVVGNTNPSSNGMNGNVFDSEYISPTISTNKGEGPKIRVKSATSKDYETANENDSINFTHPESKTRRGRVGKEVAQTLDTSCNQGVCIPVLTPDRKEKRQNGRRFKHDGEEMFTITTQDRHGIYDGFRIRKLTPRECFRLQDFPDDFKFVVSNSQLYKQAGNSITVRVLELIIRKLNL
jgi:DNA (cytosine-5)-methyltransferase 1